MSDSDATQPALPPTPGPTPTGYQRTQGGGVKWLPPTTEQLSKLLPQYDIECLLGRGGMGAVYKGTQKSLKRAVAIKILPPEVDDEDASYTERFKNEAQILARLSHPGIVGVYDFGETSEGQLYIVMEFIDGSDVAQMIAAQGRLPPEHALAIAAHVCDALKYAHEHGVVHRDIKPANILINMDGAVKVADFGLAKLADFGLAKLDEPGTTGLTKTGMAMGTPDYVAPEALVMGMAVDGRADLYALGVMLYHMLTGQVPRGAFDLPSKRLGTDPRFDAIIQKAMQMDRDSRYQSSAEIRRDLDVILTTPLVEAGGKSSAAIPKQSLHQKPVAKGPQQAGSRVRQDVAPVAPPNHALASAATPKSKAPLFIGLGVAAAVAVGAFFMSSRVRQSVDDTPRAPATTPDQTLASSATPAAAEKRGASWSAAGSVSATPLSSAPTPAKSPTTTPASTAPAANPKAVSPTPPGVSATALQNAAAKPAASTATPAPAISNLKSSISNAAPAAFPPGQWVKLFTKFEDLPKELRKPDSGAKFENDALSVGDSGLYLGLVPGRQKFTNCAWRATINGSSFTVRLRDTIKGAYIGFGPTGIELRHRSPNSGTPPPGKLITFSSPEVGIAHSWEFAAVGNRLICRCDGLVTGQSQIDQVLTGQMDMSNLAGTVRDIEVINLDGLPEAEALRILGVDEKGNDTRAAALAAEKQAMEQKQVAQAAASIPELATLDEQLKKLTAERVTAPFEAEVAKLNSGYLGGLDRKMAEEKAAGHLDSVLAIEAEKQLMQGAGAASPEPSTSGGQAGPTPCPIPSAEDDATSTTTPAVLKGLRQIYRDAYAKIEATRAANLNALTDPLTTRLKLLESDLTKKDRIADAKTVKEYREGLASRSGGLQPPSPSPSGSAPPDPTPAVGNTPLLAAATKDGFTNSLGMKFVPVKGTDVLFCIHETRRQDYAAFAAENPSITTEFNKPPGSRDGIVLSSDGNHPVVNVHWNDAKAFCDWLSKKENLNYRLPSDREWSFAVGIGEKEKPDLLPEALSGKVDNEFPWGRQWPPPRNVENLRDATYQEQSTTNGAPAIPGYDDKHAGTAPVMNFKANKLGIYDMGGNVAEWCADWLDGAQSKRVLRGQHWQTFQPEILISSRRDGQPITYRSQVFGFRVVVETKPQAAAAKPTAKPAPTPPPASATAAKSDFSNSLGMKFVKVPGTKVLFCIHETRRQDYAAYAAEVPGVDEKWKTGSAPSATVEIPVAMIRWQDAKGFCAWLSKKEGRNYRLPTDREWSFAVGIAYDEDRDATPEQLSQKITDEFPWGRKWPPPERSGNLADGEWKKNIGRETELVGYQDGFFQTSPVMSFAPNKLGLFDLAGNVGEWCEDWGDAAKTKHTRRGSSFNDPSRQAQLSSGRSTCPPDQTDGTFGFRIVVEMTAP